MYILFLSLKMDYLDNLHENIEGWDQGDAKLITKIRRMIRDDVREFAKLLLRELNYTSRETRRRIQDEDDEDDEEDEKEYDKYERRYEELRGSGYPNLRLTVDEHWRALVARKKYSELVLQEGSEEFINYLLANDLIIELPTTLAVYKKLKDKISVERVFEEYGEYLPIAEYIAQNLDDTTPELQAKYEKRRLDYVQVRAVYIKFMLAFPELFSLDSYIFLIKLLLIGSSVQDKAIFDLLLEVKEFPGLLAAHKHLNPERVFEILDYAVAQGLSSDDELFELLFDDDKKLSYLRGEVFLREGKPFHDVLLAFIKAGDFRDAARIKKNLIAEQLGLGIGYEFDCELNPDAETVLCLIEMLIETKLNK